MSQTRLHWRMIDGLLGGGYQTKSAAYTLVLDDDGDFFSVTGSGAMTLLPAATAEAGYTAAFVNNGTAPFNVDANASETINGLAGIALAPGFALVICCTGTNWIGFVGIPKERGTFVPVFTGFSVDPSGTVNWRVEGTTVHLRFGFTTGTSDNTFFTITNLPAVLTPILAQIVPIIGLVDNSVNRPNAGSVLISGTTLTFGLDGDNAGGGGFTAALNKGLQNANITISWSLMPSD